MTNQLATLQQELAAVLAAYVDRRDRIAARLIEAVTAVPSSRHLRLGLVLEETTRLQQLDEEIDLWTEAHDRGLPTAVGSAVAALMTGSAGAAGRRRLAAIDFLETVLEPVARHVPNSRTGDLLSMLKPGMWARARDREMSAEARRAAARRPAARCDAPVASAAAHHRLCQVTDPGSNASSTESSSGPDGAAK